MSLIELFWTAKNHNNLTVRGEGEGGVNPYGQPDRKKTVFFLDDFPKLGDLTAFAPGPWALSLLKPVTQLFSLSLLSIST